MAEIIVRWLADRIGCIFQVNSERFLEGMKSGILLSHIFYSYGLFSDEQVQEVIDDRMPQLQVYRAYLMKLGIVYNEETHNKIKAGNISASIKLLYHMYLCLQSTDKLQHLAISERKKATMIGSDRFQVFPVCEEVNYVPKQRIHQFGKPLQSHDHIIEWHREKHNSFLEQCKHRRRKYIKKLNLQMRAADKSTCNKYTKTPQKKIQEEMVDYGALDNESVDMSYDQLVSLQEQYRDHPIPVPNPEEALKILAKVQTKLTRGRTTDAAGIKLKRMLLNQLWDQILKQQHERFEANVINEVLKQSMFEKQMVRKVFEVRQQKDTMFECRHKMEIDVQKKFEENFCKNLFHAETKNQEKENLYYLEKNRAIELHKRLYAERKRLRLEQITESCRKIVGDFADIAMYIAEYKENYQIDYVPMQKLYLSALFNAGKPIFNLIEPIEDILNYDLEDCSEEMEEIYTIELSRHDTIMEQLLYDYLLLRWPWEVNLEEDFTPEDLECKRLGTNVLGHIVHRLLLTKYPRPVPPPSPDLPNVPIAVCIHGLENVAIITPLKEILKDRRVEVIEMQDAINYCLKVFNEEATVDYSNTLFDKEEKETEEMDHRTSAKHGGKVKKTENPKLKKVKSKANPLRKGSKAQAVKKIASISSSKENIVIEVVLPSFANKAEQTPQLFPWEIIVHSPAGELGRIVYNILNAGEPLNKLWMIKMFVQYLLNLKTNNIGGWVLVNFPNTILDAAQLEEELSSKPFPDVPKLCESDLNDYVTIKNQLEVKDNQLADDVCEKKRLSKILPNPTKEENPEYKSYLTAFIALKLIIDDKELNFDEFITATPTDPLLAFYFNQGCKYDMCFKLWDFNTLKTLAKLIVGDFSLPRRNSAEILGPSLEYLEARLDIPTGIDMPPMVRRKTPKKESATRLVSKVSRFSDTTTKAEDKKNRRLSKEPKSAKGGKGEKRARKETKKSVSYSQPQLPIVYHKETQIPEVEVEEEPAEIKSVRPGEENWNYLMCSIPDELQCVLATLWENMEEVYTNDLKEIFFRRRVLLDSIVPYISFIKAHMAKFIARPDMKQKYLHEFQELYNLVDEDMRDDDELKAEWHCRIFEFKNKLYNICDQRMTENEAERQRLVEDNWTIKIVIEIINIKTTIMQIEIDAFVDTIRLITEYYYGMVTNRPTTDVRFNKIRLKKINYEEETQENVLVNLISYTEQLMKSKDAMAEDALTPFYNIIEQSYKESNDFVVQTYKYMELNVTSLAAVFKPKDASKYDPKKPHRVTNKSTVDPKKMPTILIPDPDVIKSAEAIIEEYKCALESAFIVAQLRLFVNLSTTKKLYNSVLDRNKAAFLFIYQAIEQRYKREINSIELACLILSRAVEAECKIQPELMLIGDEFLVEPDTLLFEDALPRSDAILSEGDPKYIYSIQQLEDTFELMKIMAPNGFLPERAFSFFIQDIVTHNPEDGSPWLIPHAWRELKPPQVTTLIHDLFGSTEYIDWRDYILFNAAIRFPKAHEILAMRHFFREMDPDDTELVYEHQYHAVTMWFEKPEYDLDSVPDDETLLRRKLLKTLLWKCFRVDEARMNYTAFLLALCKDRFPVNGIARALSLSFGKEVCKTYEIGEMYLNNELEKRRLLVWAAYVKQIEHEDTIEMSEEVVKEMIETVLDTCDTERLILEEINTSIYNVSGRDENRIISSLLGYTSNDELTESAGGSYNSDLRIFEFEDDRSSSVHEDDAFSNVPIGFEEFDFPNLVYVLPFDGLINVLAAALPNIFSKQGIGEKSFREKIETLYDSLKIPDLDNNVYCHRFLFSSELTILLKNITKFSVKYPANTVFNLLENKY